MNLTNMLAVAWYHIVLVIGLIGVIVFYVWYRREQG